MVINDSLIICANSLQQLLLDIISISANLVDYQRTVIISCVIINCSRKSLFLVVLFIIIVVFSLLLITACCYYIPVER